MKKISAIVLIITLLVSCSQPSAQETIYVNSSYFEPQKAMGTIANPKLDEISGIIASRTMPGYYWVHNDSGGEAALYLINEQAQHLATLTLEGLKNRDWEELGYYQDSVSRKSYLYIGEIGDNAAKHKQITLYRIEEPTLSVPLISPKELENARKPAKASKKNNTEFPEPQALTEELQKDLAKIEAARKRFDEAMQKFEKGDTGAFKAENLRPEEEEEQGPKNTNQLIQQHIKAANIERYHLTYPDGARDAEAFVLDPIDKKLYLFTKREKSIRLYSCPLPFKNQQQHTLVFEQELPFHKIVGADISVNGYILLLKDYDNIYCYKDRNNRSLPQWLKNEPPFRIPYMPEPQGESIAWSADQDAFVTLSEQKDGVTPVLYLFLRRNAATLTP
jgi:hypothetical protein